ncbi:Gmad2 immunoglobulin-like domain-containing protein [Flavobacterium frigoris]|uniref:Immunoglobulin-like domain of spore germination n=1 Tax=Flavobacterium frigoris TaxID=229204 RepID=A0A1H9MEU7_FLAFI|nr:Gmad2 immunoglobulin-like domain-containing protein [Flavobacterium frigoris]SER22019.1 Immunoglobulin-like domain of spore germination [Flavobacterium frigoris]
MKIKSIILLLAVLVIACNKKNSDDTNSNESSTSIDTVQIAKPIEPQKQVAIAFSNEHFRQVTVEKVDGNKFHIKGQAQVWEANISWVVEDGHNELKTGFTTSDAGAPEWGNFDFTVDVEKKKEYSTLILILFEESAKDGSRTHELPIPLK